MLNNFKNKKSNNDNKSVFSGRYKHTDEYARAFAQICKSDLNA